MGKPKKQQQQQTVSYSDVAKQQPTRTSIRRQQTVQAGPSVPDPEPLINLESNQSSSNEARNSKNSVLAKRARTISKDAMDEDISSPVFQPKTASSSTDFSQPVIATVPRVNLNQPPVDQTSKSSNPPYKRPSN